MRHHTILYNVAHEFLITFRTDLARTKWQDCDNKYRCKQRSKVANLAKYVNLHEECTFQMIISVTQY